eukprot:2002024-Pleurochrysis_carterae.AAC.5
MEAESPLDQGVAMRFEKGNLWEILDYFPKYLHAKQAHEQDGREKNAKQKANTSQPASRLARGCSYLVSLLIIASNTKGKKTTGIRGNRQTDGGGRWGDCHQTDMQTRCDDPSFWVPGGAYAVLPALALGPGRGLGANLYGYRSSRGGVGVKNHYYQGGRSCARLAYSLGRRGVCAPSRPIIQEGQQRPDAGLAQWLAGVRAQSPAGPCTPAHNGTAIPAARSLFVE